ncbi:hypothetical protein TheveDRAFT_1351 [Thermanaerovibrio velox DSM 12556]|uniref:Uncharacterized protein n=1 Tax=Thermanaerovibrio velox DSM 12556 TaxID=926567 RepID=H0UNQ5_9BACT|nr:hypothetical protein [Thermanaerovibrio velox]EHM10470.1 hypothetical protein TheveDRAFT_1351 [Thermanaerovibrio velox DSM 12556]
MRALYALLISAVLSLYGIAWATPLQVLREAAMWKFYPAEKVQEAFFPCQMAPQYCDKLGIRDSDDGFYKVFFHDGFVLTLLSSGDVAEHYYLPSEVNLGLFKENLERYGSASFDKLPEGLKKRLMLRVEDMKRWAAQGSR